MKKVDSAVDSAIDDSKSLALDFPFREPIEKYRH